MRGKTKGWTRLIATLLMLMFLTGALGRTMGSHAIPVRAATSDQIEEAIARGVAWLASGQNPDGSWGTGPYVPAKTCFVLTKLQERAYELGYASPFDPDYEYSDGIALGWSYIFTTTRTLTQTLSVQDHTAGASGTMDDPDSNGNGYGVYFYGEEAHYVYTTGTCLMALGTSGTPDRPNEGGLDFDGDGSPDTFREIAQDAADWLAFAQVDGGPSEGGWHYTANSVPADNSNSGYAVLGLAYAEDLGCAVPKWVMTELNVWIDAIQDPVDGDANDGGSWYRVDWPLVNELKTGNLLLEMAFCGDYPDAQRFQNALDYIERQWRDPNVDYYLGPGWGYSSDPANYLAMHALMRGLTYSDIDLLDTDGDSERDDAWYNQEPSTLPEQDFASVLVMQQNENGSWPDNCFPGRNFPVLCTAWALLILERVAPQNPFSLSIAKTVTPTTSVTCHGTVTYTVVLRNDGKQDTPGTLLTDTLPSNVQFDRWVVQPPGASIDGDQITWSGTVTTGEAITFTFTALYVGECGEALINAAEFESPAGHGSNNATFRIGPFCFYMPLVLRNDENY